MKAMAWVVPHLIARVGAPPSDTIFATDATGVGHDCGGWGVVAADIDHALALQSFHLAHQPGKAVCKLSGDYAGERDPSTPSLRRVPFTRLPTTLFDPAETTWEDVAAGRWRLSDHITLGEARVVVRLMRALAACPQYHSTKVLSLEDNMATAGCMSNGRSPSPALNYLCRQRCAATMAARLTLVLPWTETSLMPADEISRYGFKTQRPSTTGPTPDGQSPGVHIDPLPEITPALCGVVGGA